MEKPLLSPKNDLIFKLIFGEHKNTDILIDFLQAILDIPPEEYSHIEIVDPHLRQIAPGDKLGILDIKLHTKSGKVIDIDIQAFNVANLRERVVYYTSKMITAQIGEGDTYENIKKAITILITDFVLITDSEEYHNGYVLHDPCSGSTFTDIIEVHTLELPKVPQKTDRSNLWN
ncbi:hypothetical protein AGMMS49944_19490 [Spirochaetia bacterium]|nr:hypothetical protein AGMMS49944_19490 [Spirochaetia bacterium]